MQAVYPKQMSISQSSSIEQSQLTDQSSKHENKNYMSFLQSKNTIEYHQRQLTQEQSESIQVYADFKSSKFKKIFLISSFIFIILILSISPFLPKAIINQPNQKSQPYTKQILRFNQDFINFFLIVKISLTIIIIISLFFYLRNLIKTHYYLNQANRITIGMLSLIFIIFNITFTSWKKYNEIFKSQKLSGIQQRQLFSYILLIVSLLLFWTAFTNQILYKRSFYWGFFYQMPYFIFLYIWLLDYMLNQTINFRCIFGKGKQCEIQKNKIQKAMSYTTSITLSYPLIVYTMIPLGYIIFNFIKIIMLNNKLEKRVTFFTTFSFIFIVFFYFMLLTGGLFYLDICSSRILIVYSILNFYIISLHIMYSKVSQNSKEIIEIQEKLCFQNSLIKNQIS